MKLLIDIPEHIYEHAKEMSEDSGDEFEAMRAIANGTQQESRSENPNTCGDAISRQATLEKFKKTYFDNKTVIRCAELVINGMPSVTPQQRKTQMLDESNFDVNQYEMDLQSAYDCGRASTQQRTGRWIQKEEEGEAEPFIIWECSECHCVDGKPSYKYCPQCGAEMEVEE